MEEKKKQQIFFEDGTITGISFFEQSLDMELQKRLMQMVCDKVDEQYQNERDEENKLQNQSKELENLLKKD